MKRHIDGKYVGTFAILGSEPREVWSSHGRLVVRSAYGRRKNWLDRSVSFVKACRTWWRVQRYGSQA